MLSPFRVHMCGMNEHSSVAAHASNAPALWARFTPGILTHVHSCTTVRLFMHGRLRCSDRQVPGRRGWSAAPSFVRRLHPSLKWDAFGLERTC